MKSPSSRAIWNPTKDFFESLDLAEISHFIPGSTVKGHKYPSNSSKMHEIFTPVVHNVNGENSKGARLVKGGEIGKKRNNQTSIRPRVRKKLHSFWKKRNKTCLCFDTPFFQSFNINFKVRSQKNGHIFFVLLLRINFLFSWVEKVLNCPQRPKNQLWHCRTPCKTKRNCQDCWTFQERLSQVF